MTSRDYVLFGAILSALLVFGVIMWAVTGSAIALIIVLASLVALVISYWFDSKRMRLLRLSTN
jgi:Na+-driven multidrug efflux pump